MKNLKQIFTLMLVCALGFLASCSDEEDVFYYSFKSIEYTVEEEDGVTTYDIPEGIYRTVTNNSAEELKYSIGNIYEGYNEFYLFKCATPEEFNPTPGYVHVPLPIGLSSDGTVSVGSTMGEYTMDTMMIHDETSNRQEHVVPPMKKLSISRALKIQKRVFTYTATFERHPKGKDLVVKGKFIHQIPVSAIFSTILEDIE